mmetsp:Transcript_85070/g.237336  ORF Transcript_85070/g.237336 Transcript_85070/m.237336 type:complete len:215 (+) Transcript_85070:181-825(+)
MTAYAARMKMCIPWSESMRSLSCPTWSANAAASNDGPNFASFFPGFTQPRSPASSPAVKQLGHSERSRQRCVNTAGLLLGSASHSSKTARKSRSASPRVRLTCLFLTLSVVLLHSRCFRRMCRRRTCEGCSSFRRFGGEVATSSVPSRNATMDPKPKSPPTWPNHCTAASTNAPAATRGRPPLRLNTVETAMARPMALYSARHTKATPLTCRSR